MWVSVSLFFVDSEIESQSFLVDVETPTICEIEDDDCCLDGSEVGVGSWFNGGSPSSLQRILVGERNPSCLSISSVTWSFVGKGTSRRNSRHKVTNGSRYLLQKGEP